jgi:hypothetical protein
VITGILQTATTRAEIADFAVHSNQTPSYRDLPQFALQLTQLG